MAKHGRSLYHRGCRCPVCVIGNRTYVRDWTAQRRKGEDVCPIRAHGTIGGYTNWHCRCVSCKSVYSTYRRDRYMTGKLAGAAS